MTKKTNLKIALFSDTHNKHMQLYLKEYKGDFERIKDCDIIIHAGDISMGGTPDEIKKFFEWYNKLDTKATKIVIAGNHDIWLDSEHPYQRHFKVSTEKTKKEFLDNYPSVVYLENDWIYLEDEDIKIYGTPLTPSFGKWAFNANEEDIYTKIKESIEESADIIVSHGPVHLYLDMVRWPRVNEDPCVGSKSLSRIIDEIRPLLFVCGHIHEGYGAEFINGETYAVNCSVLTERYQLINDIVFLDLVKNEKGKWEIL